ncbi:MAG: trypsin-like peptidase domain-containing protein [Myxococcales bacterium]|nr:trypsin-like peptidase domain-containing protein [Myxococcales bacterium]
MAFDAGKAGPGPAAPPPPKPQGTYALPPAAVPASAAYVGGPDFAAVFARVSPSVVGVAAGRRKRGQFQVQRTGTGLVWDAAGHILTNDHLVADADEIRVRLITGKVLAARVLAGDGPMDLALLAADGPVPPPVPRARADALRPGEWVAAIGNPFGLQHSITVGVVSAVGRRRLPGGGPRFGSFIQADVAVNPGNSGGPLVDARGQTVGLNTAMVGDAQGLAFAIPIEQADVVVGRLLSHGRFERGYGGLVPRPVTDRQAADAGLDARQGARISKLVEDGPGAQAGLVPGDIILRFNGEAVEQADELPWLIASTAPGTAVPVHVARGTARLDLTLKVSAAR